MRIEKTCTCCNTKKVVEMDDVAYRKWCDGEHIQDVVPEMPIDDRELLISGVCGVCFDAMFADEEDDT